MNHFSWLVAGGLVCAVIVGTLAGCASEGTVQPDAAPPAVEAVRPPIASAQVPAAPPIAKDDLVPWDDLAPLPAPIVQAKSRWVPVRWKELPGFDADGLHEAWNAWIRSCERPLPAFAALCPEIRVLSLASGA